MQSSTFSNEAAARRHCPAMSSPRKQWCPKQRMNLNSIRPVAQKWAPYALLLFCSLYFKIKANKCGCCVQMQLRASMCMGRAWRQRARGIRGYFTWDKCDILSFRRHKAHNILALKLHYPAAKSLLGTIWWPKNDALAGACSQLA